MSLINQMLRDLEQRSRQKVREQDFALSGLCVSTLSRLKYNKKMLGLLVLSILSIALLFVLRPSHFHAENKAVIYSHSFKSPGFINEQMSHDTLSSPIISDQHTAASVVTGLTLQLQKETTTLRVLLSQDVLYQMSKLSDNEYAILMERSQLVTNLPAINTLNSALQNIRMINQNNGNVLMVLTLKEGAELNHIELINAEKFPELQIDLTYKGDVYSEPATLSKFTPHPYTPDEAALKKVIVNMTAEDEYQQALQYQAQGFSEKAISVLTNLISQFPDYDSARESLVKILLDQGKQLQAKTVIQAGLQRRPNYYPFAELKARILVSEGQISDAVELLQSVAPSLNKDPDYHAFIAALYQRQGKSLLASKLYEQLLPLEPDNSMWWMGLGIAYEDLGKHNEATQAYARAEQADKLTPELKAYVMSRMHSLE